MDKIIYAVQYPVIDMLIVINRSSLCVFESLEENKLKPTSKDWQAVDCCPFFSQ